MSWAKQQQAMPEPTRLGKGGEELNPETRERL